MASIDTVITQIDQDLADGFGSNPLALVGTSAAGTATLGASPQYWGSSVYNLQQAMGWPLPAPGSPGSLFGWVDEINADIPALAYQIRMVNGYLAQGLAAAKSYALAVAEYAAAVAVGAGSSAAGGATATAQSLFNQANAHADALFNQAEADLNTWAVAFVRSLNDVQNNAVGVAETLYNTEQSNLGAWVNALVKADQDVQNNAVAHADALFNQTEADLNTWAAALVQADRDVQSNLANTITNTSAGDRQYADVQIQAAVPVAVAQAVTQVQPQLEAIKTELTTCLEPLCDTVTPNARDLGKLGGLLKTLGALGLDALLAGLVAEAVADPAAAAGQIEAAGGWAVDLSTEMVNAVLG